MRVDRLPNVSGWAGTERTIRAMEDMVKRGRMDETVIFTASQILRKVDHKNYFGQVAALHEWVKKNIHYVRDPNGVELLRDPMWVLYYKTGDCDDQVVLLSSLAEAVGFKTRFKAIKGDAQFPKEFSHVYSQVLIPGKGWVTSDTIVPHAKLGWEAEERFGSYTWGGLGMLGNLGAEATAAPAAPALNFWGQLGQGLTQTFTNTVQGVANAYSTQLLANIGNKIPAATAAPAPQAAARSGGGLGGAFGPIAIIGGAGILALLVMRKKRR